MNKTIPLLFSALFILANLAETVHCHEDGCDVPCPGVCMGGSCGIYCDEPASAGAPDPVKKKIWAPSFCSVLFVPQAFESEIFHPPAI